MIHPQAFLLAGLLDVTFGNFFWSTLIFLLFFLLLRRYAWKPILSGLKTREENIENALKQAEAARDEMSKLKADNESMIKAAQLEKDKILTDAAEMRDQMIAKAKQEAAEVASREAEKAKKQIEAEKANALNEIKSISAEIALEIAEKVIGAELKNKTDQEELVKREIEKLNLN